MMLTAQQTLMDCYGIAMATTTQLSLGVSLHVAHPGACCLADSAARQYNLDTQRASDGEVSDCKAV